MNAEQHQAAVHASQLAECCNSLCYCIVEGEEGGGDFCIDSEGA